MPINIENTLTFTTGSILGFLVGRYIDHWLARSRNIESIQIVEFNKGAATFRAEFTKEIFLLRNSAKYSRHNTPKAILNDDVMARHERAKIMFEPYLKESDLSGFNLAWDNYKNYENRYTMDESKNFHSDEEMSQYCLEHLNALLKYANPKSA